MPIFQHEILRCLDGTANVSEQINSIQHHAISGFESATPPNLKNQFTAWVAQRDQRASVEDEIARIDRHQWSSRDLFAEEES